ncbi:MAG TPA: response regulator [Terriglobales bacterium]|nr:response regulator [Terriglobales bacterium]
MPSRKRVLFVDDEPSIRLTLPPVLEQNGYDVRSAGSVAEALVEINSQAFDALLSDLNIGEEGDGFLVVSAMRHIQPKCITVILTGYPAFDTALQAIREQVDDYLVKPADVETLLKCLEDKFQNGRDEKSSGRKQLAVLLRENSAAILKRVLEGLKRDSRTQSILSDDAKLGSLPGILNSVISAVESESAILSSEQLMAAEEHGAQRTRLGCFPSTIVSDFDLLERHIYEAIEADLMSIGGSTMVGELKRMQQVLNSLMKAAVTASEDDHQNRKRA